MKEAVCKAIGARGRAVPRFPEISLGVSSSSSSSNGGGGGETSRAPVLTFFGQTGADIVALGVRRHHVSVSHDGDLAIANVILES